MTCQKQINYQTLYENIKYQINRTNVRSTVQKLDQSDQKLCKQIKCYTNRSKVRSTNQKQINRSKVKSGEQMLDQHIKTYKNTQKL